MKISKHKIYLFICITYIIVTGLFNLYGYFHLPEEIATQFSFSGEQVNHMPTSIYMIVSFGAVLILSLFCITKGQEQKLKYLLTDTIIVICNIIMVSTQL